jgi:hypothetical protein
MRSTCNLTHDPHFVAPVKARRAIVRLARFCWSRILLSVVSSRSSAAPASASSHAPLLSLSHPLAWAVGIVWPGSAWARPFGVPWSKRMRIDRHGGLPWGRDLEALRDKFQYRCDLFPRDVELFHHFFDAQILKVLNDGRNRQAGITKHLRATNFAGILSTAGHRDQSRIAMFFLSSHQRFCQRSSAASRVATRAATQLPAVIAEAVSREAQGPVNGWLPPPRRTTREARPLALPTPSNNHNDQRRRNVPMRTTRASILRRLVH